MGRSSPGRPAVFDIEGARSLVQFRTGRASRLEGKTAWHEIVYVRTSHWRCKAEFAEESVKLFKDLVFRTMEKEPNCLAMQLMGEGEARIAVTVFTSERAYRAWKKDRTSDIEGITDAFAHMYVDGEPPCPFDYPLLASRKFERHHDNDGKPDHC